MKLIQIFLIGHFVLVHWPLFTKPTAPALSAVTTEVTQAGTVVSTTASVLTGLDLVLLAQGIRAHTTLEIASRNDAALLDSRSLSWMDSPTQLPIGVDNQNGKMSLLSPELTHSQSSSSSIQEFDPEPSAISEIRLKPFFGELQNQTPIDEMLANQG